MAEWFASDQDDIDLGAAMSAASSSPGGWNVGAALGSVQGVANTVSGLVRTLYQTRTDIARSQLGSAIDLQRQNAQLAAETIRARQLAAAAATPPIFGGSLQQLLPLAIVIGGGALLWRRFAR